ncbi:hypothetical protein GCM10017714_10730 [Curtobacterium pusillum]|uniref:Uncharacterized protein n=1 Tax=Curtobacterium pusillum TaxID=69373 RepID=A0ABX2M5V3_9MICO|nr:hypothetical protein [Curtobacterium pusillum]NUU12873.1 hypothetical protein [Curtobacterium pusillum]GLK30333.1 hypothetical protein GCM10017610_06180 [Curtobacterium pusillum]
MTSTQERKLRQRRLDALRGIATVPLGEFPITQPDQTPELAEVADRIRQIRSQSTPIQRPFNGIRTGFRILPVARLTGSPATGWTMDDYNLERRNGHPLGALFFRADDGRTGRVAVRWNHDDEQLEAAALHDTESCLADTFTDTERGDLQHDTRGRVGALLAANPEVGSLDATTEAEHGFLDAAGLSGDTSRADR